MLLNISYNLPQSDTVETVKKLKVKKEIV